MLTMTDLFCGAGGSSTGAAQVPGVEIRIAANHWQLAVDIHNANHPDADHASVDLHEEDPRYFPRTDFLWASPECFTAGHLVTTAHGQVPIEDITVGDMVLTHKGQWRRVTRTQQRQAQTVIVKGQGHPGIETTATHKFWMRDSHLAWKGRKDQYKRVYGEPGWAPIETAPTSEALWATPATIAALAYRELPAIFGTDQTAAWWLVGRWLGDGSLSFGNNSEVVITCGNHEADELEQRLTNTGARWARYQKRTAVVFSTWDKAARDWMHSNFGHGAAGKQIPSWALTAPREHREALLAGYFSADGYENTLTHGVQRNISTVSRKLAVSARLLAESLGHRTALVTDKRDTYSIEGRTGAARPQFRITWNPNPSPRRSPVAFQDGDHSWSRVHSVTPTLRTETVFNIEVDEDHSYVLDGIVVANCTKWSQAGGAKNRPAIEEGLFEDPEADEAAQRSRLLMFDVLRFAEHHRYAAMIIENVVDIAVSAKYTLAWAEWQRQLRNLGYRYRVVSLNSMHAQSRGLPAPQSRDRIYIVCWLAGTPAPDIDSILRPMAWCPRCEKMVESSQSWKNGRSVGRYRQQYVYVHPGCGTVVEPGWLPAYTAIDWTIPGTPVGDRARPLAEKTRARIAAGIARYWMAPFLAEVAGHTYERHPGVRTSPVQEAFGTFTTTQSKALLVPVEGRDGKEPLPAWEAARTQTTRNETGLVTAGFILDNQFSNRGVRVSDPLPTQTTATTKALITPDVLPFAVELRGGGSDARTMGEPLATVTANGNHHALLMRNNTSRGSGAEMSTPVTEWMRTITTTGHQSLIQHAGPRPPRPRVSESALAAAERHVDECLFRMITPLEAAAGMGFPSTYIWDTDEGKKISDRNIVKCVGNAVTPGSAGDLVMVVAAALN